MLKFSHGGDFCVFHDILLSSRKFLQPKKDFLEEGRVVSVKLPQRKRSCLNFRKIFPQQNNHI